MYLSTLIDPFSFRSIPILARPMSFVLNDRPIDTSTFSVLISGAPSIVATISPSSARSTFATFLPRCSLIFDFFSSRSISFETSSSSSGRAWESISTISTLHPSRDMRKANSQPMTPAPIIRSDDGISVIVTISLDDMIRSPSNGKTGMFSGLDPVAIIIFSASIDLVPPFFSISISCSDASLPCPLSKSMLWCLNRNSTPLTRPSTILFFLARTASRSTLTGPSTLIPNFSASRIFLYNDAVAIIAFVGIHPQLRQTPPSRSFSMHATLAPSCAARIAATYPPGPPPSTATSYRSII